MTVELLNAIKIAAGVGMEVVSCIGMFAALKNKNDQRTPIKFSNLFKRFSTGNPYAYPMIPPPYYQQPIPLPNMMMFGNNRPPVYYPYGEMQTPVTLNPYTGHFTKSPQSWEEKEKFNMYANNFNNYATPNWGGMTTNPYQGYPQYQQNPYQSYQQPQNVYGGGYQYPQYQQNPYQSYQQSYPQYQYQVNPYAQPYQQPQQQYGWNNPYQQPQQNPYMNQQPVNNYYNYNYPTPGTCDYPYGMTNSYGSSSQVYGDYSNYGVSPEYYNTYKAYYDNMRVPVVSSVSNLPQYQPQTLYQHLNTLYGNDQGVYSYPVNTGVISLDNGGMDMKRALSPYWMDPVYGLVKQDPDPPRYDQSGRLIQTYHFDPRTMPNGMMERCLMMNYERTQGCRVDHAIYDYDENKPKSLNESPNFYHNDGTDSMSHWSTGARDTRFTNGGIPGLPDFRFIVFHPEVKRPDLFIDPLSYDYPFSIDELRLINEINSKAAMNNNVPQQPQMMPQNNMPMNMNPQQQQVAPAAPVQRPVMNTPTPAPAQKPVNVAPAQSSPVSPYDDIPASSIDMVFNNLALTEGCHGYGDPNKITSYTTPEEMKIVDANRIRIEAEKKAKQRAMDNIFNDTDTAAFKPAYSDPKSFGGNSGIVSMFSGPDGKPLV